MRITRNFQDVSSSRHNAHAHCPEFEGPPMHWILVRILKPENKRSQIWSEIDADTIKGPSPASPMAQSNIASSTSIVTSYSKLNTAASIDHSTRTGANPPGRTILHAAVNNNCVEGVAASSAMRTDPNAQTTDKGWVPLWVAAYHGNLETSRLLLDAGASINTANHEGHSSSQKSRSNRGRRACPAVGCAWS